MECSHIRDVRMAKENRGWFTLRTFMEIYLLRCLVTLKTDSHLPCSMQGIILQCYCVERRNLYFWSLSRATTASSLREKAKDVRAYIWSNKTPTPFHRVPYFADVQINEWRFWLDQTLPTDHDPSLPNPCSDLLNTQINWSTGQCKIIPQQSGQRQTGVNITSQKWGKEFEQKKT